MLQTTIFVLSFSWRVARGLNSSLFAFLSQLKKTEVEVIVPRQVPQKYKKSMDMLHYLKEQKKTCKTQQVIIPALSDSEKLIFLN